MHISDGIINLKMCAAAGVFAATAVTYSVKKMDSEDIPKTALMTAAVFAASLIHIKIGPSSAHLLLTGITGIILGLSVFPTVLIALLFQAILFQHGGITTLGINTITMAVPAYIIYMLYLIIKNFKIKNNILQNIINFILCSLSVLLTALFVSLFLIFAGKEFQTAAKLIFSAHIPIAVAEGFIGMFFIQFIKKIKPEIIP